VYTSNCVETENRNPDLALPLPKPDLVHQALAQRSAEVDQRVRQAYAAFLEPHFASGLALVALGSFGRKELFPHSDVNLLLLVGSDSETPRPEALAAFLGALRDSGLKPVHSVQTLEECVTQHADNAELIISLLDRRLLAGDVALSQSLDARFLAFTTKSASALAFPLAGLAVGRRAKYQNTIYHLQPNVKDSPGGLRDLQTARWLQILEPRHGKRDLSTAFDFLAAVRIRLHEIAGHDENVLSFEAQEALSNSPALLMRDYYRNVRRVDRAVRQAIEAATEKRGALLGRFYEWRSRLSTSTFTVSHDRVLLRRGHAPRDLSLFEFVARHGLRLAPDTVDRLQGSVPEASWADWKRLLSLPRASVGLRSMQETGVLASALPEWRNIECLVVRDFYHRYSVDEHAMVAIASVETVTDTRFKELFREVNDPAAVRFALLLRDIGKGAGQDNTEASVNIASDVLGRLAAPEEDRATVEFLILRHRELSTVMNSRDLHDGSTAHALAECVGTIERLKMLTMLTYGDVSAVNPEAMTQWHLDQLWRVYNRVREELTRELGTERVHDAAGMPADRARYLEGLPIRYLRLYTQEEISFHFALAQQLASRPVAFDVRPERGYYKLTLLTRDRSKLFASVVGTISSFGLNILKVEAFSNASGVVVDTFTFSDPHRTLNLHPAEVDRLRRVLRRVVEGKEDVEQLLRDRPKPFRSPRVQMKPVVSFDSQASDAATLIEIEAEDRPGLLYDLANTFSRANCSIDVVMVDTQAHKALDVFYVTCEGRKVDDELEAWLKADLLAACSGGSRQN
jgi:[protein-PII] uridylyltransferase